MADRGPLVDMWCLGCCVAHSAEPGMTKCPNCGGELVPERRRSSTFQLARELERQRDEARYYARAFAHAALTGIAVPQLVVAASLAYPVVPGDPQFYGELGEEGKRVIRDEVMRRVAADLDAKEEP